MGLIDRAILQDEINQALNALFRNGQLPYIKTSNGLTFDGDTTGKEVIDGYFVKISDTPVKAEDVTAVFLFSEEDGKKYAVEEMAVANEGDKVFITGKVRYDSGGSNDGVWVVIVNSDNAQFTKGVYVVKMGNSYVCEIHGIKTETIHPIDPKFWAIETMETVFAHGAELSERDAAILNAYASQKLPIFIRAKLQISDIYTMECAAVFTLLLTPDRTAYSAVASNARVDVIQSEDLNGGWVVSLISGT